MTLGQTFRKVTEYLKGPQSQGQGSRGGPQSSPPSGMQTPPNEGGFFFLVGLPEWAWLASPDPVLCPTFALPPAYPSNRGKRCNTWSYTLTPTAKPGQFTRDNRGERGVGGRGAAALGT